MPFISVRLIEQGNALASWTPSLIGAAGDIPDVPAALVARRPARAGGDRPNARAARTSERPLMCTKNPDVVVVGAGIAGASIAAVLARGGLEVLLLERQRAYRDRVRGEYMAPWGVLEARAVALETVIRGAHAVDARYSVI